jgi:hypothetical protein
MSDDEIVSVAESAGIEIGVDADLDTKVWVANEEQLIDFACLLENRIFEKFSKRVPDAWMILDKTTRNPVRLSLTDPGDHWLAECYYKIPLYST